MKAVADSSVLIFFAKIKKIELLLKLFPELFITMNVFDEIMAGKKKGFLDSLEIQKKIQERKIKIIQSNEESSGEESTIFAAKEKKIKIVLMDDFVGIKKALLDGLTAYSCPYLLLRALKEKQISKKEFNELLDKLLLHNYFISPKLLKKIIELSEIFMLA